MTDDNNLPNEAGTPDQAVDQQEGGDPIGPIALTKRSRVGARAMALVGTAGLATLAVNGFLDTCMTTITIEQ